MKKIFTVMVLLGLSLNAQADVFKLDAGFTNLETVVVGDAGNAGELSGVDAGGEGQSRICGSVDYNYNIGKYEVTAKQYCDFLNYKAQSDTYGLYNTNMDVASYSNGCNIQRSGSSGSYSYSVASDWANRPVNYVSYWDACRFANWLGNGQGDGDTETGAYTLNGYNGEDGSMIQRNVGWKWAVTSEDEWHKAAYYKGGGTNAGYWLYPTSSDTAPGRDVADVSGNNANYQTGYPDYDFLVGDPYYRTNVGEFQNSASGYGTFDQGGNVFEWIETLDNKDTSAWRGLRGGSFGDGLHALPASYANGAGQPAFEYQNLGFRVVQAVPEPSSMIALIGGLVGLLGLPRKK